VRYIFFIRPVKHKEASSQTQGKTFSQKFNRKERIEQFQKIYPDTNEIFRKVDRVLFISTRFVRIRIELRVIQDQPTLACCITYSSFWLRALGEQANNKPDSSLGSDFPEYQLGNNRSKSKLIDLHTYQTE
jgi:hypothetical protein